MSEELRVSVIEDELTWQDPGANRARYDQHFYQLQSTDLIVLPEMFSTGFSMNPWEAYETMEGETVSWMLRSAQQLQAVITGSLIMKIGEDYVNRMIWAQPDGELEFYDKRHLFRFGNENVHYKGGNDRVIVEYKGWRIALFICYDLRFPVWSRNCNDYDLALYVANWPDARQFAWDSLLIARAIENQVYVAASNRLGSDPLGNTFSGGSALLDFKGQSMSNFSGDPEMRTCALSLAQLNQCRLEFPASLDSDQFEIS